MSRDCLVAIGSAVVRAGGDLDDARHLRTEWERLGADRRGRVDRLRYDAAHPRCRCVDGGDVDEDGRRCERCYGLIGQEAG